MEKKIKAVSVLKKLRIMGITVGVLIVILAAVSLVSSHFSSDSKTTKIGFEDIGELDTQVAYCTVVDVIDDPRKILDFEVPFTGSKCIYSYDVVVKAGVNFEKIKWQIEGDKIKISIPEPYITDSYVNEESGKVYYENESIFSPITFDESMEARKDLLQNGIDNSIANGLYENARYNAEKILINFFSQPNEYKDYSIEIEWK